MLSVSRRYVHGLPILTATITVGLSVDDAELARFRELWTAMYDHHPRFALEVDLTNVSVIGGFQVLDHVCQVLRDLRPRSKRQIPFTGIAVPMLARPLVEAGLLVYPPITPLLRASDIESVRALIDAEARRPAEPWGTAIPK